MIIVIGNNADSLTVFHGKCKGGTSSTIPVILISDLSRHLASNNRYHRCYYFMHEHGCSI